MPLEWKRKPKLHRILEKLVRSAGDVGRMDDADYAQFCRLWHEANGAVKDAIHAGGGKAIDSRFDRNAFEALWGAQSTIFMADMLPYLHAKLMQHYHRKQVLKVLDVGAATGFGTQFLASLHQDHSIYSRMDVEAIDINGSRKRWVQAMAPNVAFSVGDLFELPRRHWDIVLCSHVVEHTAEPRLFIEQLRDVCRGFAFVYTPYNESPRIPVHLSTITEADYDGMPCELHRIKSMGWHPNVADDLCLLAVIDCRKPAPPASSAASTA